MQTLLRFKPFQDQMKVWISFGRVCFPVWVLLIYPKLHSRDWWPGKRWPCVVLFLR